MINKEMKTDAVMLVDELISKAVECGASDIHFEPGIDEMQVKYRLDGALKVVETIPSGISQNVVARLKVLSGLLTYRNDIPQEGRISSKTNGSKVTDKRVAVFPTIHGQRVVVRLFYEHNELMNIEHLGFSDYVLDELRKISAQSEGFLLLTGPAGSGKSTTLAAMLRYVLKPFPGKSIISL